MLNIIGTRRAGRGERHQAGMHLPVRALLGTGLLGGGAHTVADGLHPLDSAVLAAGGGGHGAGV
jgi:hypothetical protein